MSETSRRFPVGRLLVPLLAGIATALLPVVATAHNGPLTKVSFVESHRKVLLGTLPTYVAQQEGFFRRHGVAVHFMEGGGGGATMRLISTGNADMAEGGLSAAILAAKTDPNIELVGDWYHSANVLVWIAPAKSKVNSVADLKGGKIGYSHSGSASERLAKLAIRKAGVKEVKFVSVGGMGDNWAAARSGVITAGWAMEPFLSKKVDKGQAKIVLQPGNYIHHFYLGGIDVNKPFAEKHPQAVRGVFAALDEAIAFIKAHPDRAAAIGAKVYGYPKAIIATGIKRYIKDDVWDLKTDWKAFDTVIRGMRESGTLSGPLDIKHLMNQQYLPKADRSPTA